MDTPHSSAIQRIAAALVRSAAASARAAVLVLCVGAASSAAHATGGTSAASIPAPVAAASQGAASSHENPPPSSASAARDATQFASVARFIETANGPTPVPSPTPEPTIAPPPTPEPEQHAPAPVAPPPPAPTAAPAPVEAPPPPPTAGVPWGLDTAPMDGYSRQLFDDTNGRRASQGLPPLRVNGYLIGIARIRSQDMADHNYFAHLSPVTGDNAFTLMDKHGVSYGWAGENLAKNNYPDSQAVAIADQALWDSPPHRENILNPHYTDMGIALSIDASGMKYFTIIFTGPA